MYVSVKHRVCGWLESLCTTGTFAGYSLSWEAAKVSGALTHPQVSQDSWRNNCQQTCLYRWTQVHTDSCTLRCSFHSKPNCPGCNKCTLYLTNNRRFEEKLHLTWQLKVQTQGRVLTVKKHVGLYTPMQVFSVVSPDLPSSYHSVSMYRLWLTWQLPVSHHLSCTCSTLSTPISKLTSSCQFSSNQQVQIQSVRGELITENTWEWEGHLSATHPGLINM